MSISGATPSPSPPLDEDGSPERSTPLVDEVMDDDDDELILHDPSTSTASKLPQVVGIPNLNGVVPVDRFSPVSNASLGPASPGPIHDLSSFSEESVLPVDDDRDEGAEEEVWIEDRINLKDLEDGEIEVRAERRRRPRSAQETSPRPRKPPKKKRRKKDEEEEDLSRRRYHDLPRYDVRNLINKRRSGREQTPTPPRKSRHRSYGRSMTRSRTKSRSLSRSRTRSRSRSRSRSISPRRKKRVKPTRLKNKRAKERTVTAAPKETVRNQKKTATKSATKTAKKKKQRDKSPEPVKKKHRRVRHSSGEETLVSLSKADRPKKSKKAPKHASTVASGTSSTTVAKEVFASGDNILVSVNFGPNSVPTNGDSSSKGRSTDVTGSASNELTNQKPAAVIDIMSSPYLVIESSPKETIDLASGDEDEPTTPEPIQSQQPIASNIVTTTSALSEGPGSSQAAVTSSSSGDIGPFPTVSSAGASSSASASGTNNGLPKGPCTPPSHEEEAIDFALGPQTPQSDMSESYDPCNPTESPDVDFGSDNGDSPINLSAFDLDNSTSSGKRLNNSGISSSLDIPFLTDRVTSDKPAQNGSTSLSSEMPMDIAVDSPNSPQGSDLSDLFEPPSLFSSAKKKTPTKSAKSNNTLLSKPARSKAKKANKSVQMRLVDDKLRIIDDVPTSAVEMAVKEKFLKKVQRQERIVDEIKSVLKPFYNKKKISKASYKEIMRKCVPKVCHSKNGAINTMKIQKLVNGYVKKYHHVEKRHPQI